MKEAIFILFEVIYLNILTLPMAWEINNDKKGDFDKVRDVVVRGILAIACGIVVFLLGLTGLPHHGIIQSVLMSIAIHFMMFDYLIAATLGHKDWFGYLGEKGPVDNIYYWRTLTPWGRFLVRMIWLAITIIIYF